MADLQLVVIDGPNAGTEFDIAGSTVIGRDPSSGIVLDDAESSRRHASVSAEGDAIVVEDLGSTNGTYVAGERIEGSRRVGSGDRIRIGTTVMEVRAQAQATAFAPVPEAPDAQATQIGSLPPVDEAPPPPPVPEAPEAPAAFEPPAPPPPPPPPEPEPVAFSEPPPPEGATEIGHAPEPPADDGATELRPIPGGFEDTPNEGATEMRPVPSFEPQGESTFAPPPGGGGGIEPPADATFAPPPGGGGGIEPPADATFAPPPGGGGGIEPPADATYAPPPGGGAESGPPPPPPGGFGGDPGAPPPPPPFSGGPPPPPPGGFGGPESGPPPPPAFGTPPSGGPGYAPPGGGQLAPPAFAGAPGGPMPPKNPVAEWLLSYFVPFYALYWFHRSNKELEAWSGGRIEYNATSSLLAITLGWLIIVPPFVAWSHYMERIREGQRMAGLPQTANFWGSIGRAILIYYNVKWHQDQFNEIGTRPPQY